MSMSFLKQLVEAFEGRKFNKGKVSFSSSSFSDHHIQRAIAEIAKARGIKSSEIEARIQSKIDELRKSLALCHCTGIMDIKEVDGIVWCNKCRKQFFPA